MNCATTRNSSFVGPVPDAPPNERKHSWSCRVPPATTAGHISATVHVCTFCEVTPAITCLPGLFVGDTSQQIADWCPALSSRSCLPLDTDSGACHEEATAKGTSGKQAAPAAMWPSHPRTASFVWPKVQRHNCWEPRRDGTSAHRVYVAVRPTSGCVCSGSGVGGGREAASSRRRSPRPCRPCRLLPQLRRRRHGVLCGQGAQPPRRRLFRSD